jgi:hypothetical protein
VSSHAEEDGIRWFAVPWNRNHEPGTGNPNQNTNAEP